MRILLVFFVPRVIGSQRRQLGFVHYWLPNVLFVIEFTEQFNHEEILHNEEDCRRFWKSAVWLPEELQVVIDDYEELDQLQLSYVLLPPGLTKLHGSHQIVAVHHDVHKRIDDS